MINVNVTFFTQPIGQFALGKMSAIDIIKIMTKDPLKYDPLTFEFSGSVQRDLSPNRLTQIANYAKGEDACFPTAIILALPKNPDMDTTIATSPDYYWKLISESHLEINDNYSEFALIVDGQHRMFGLKKSGEEVYSKFDIPVVFLFEPTLEQQAIIFSIINEKQTKVSYSLVAQLFGVIDKRTEEKVAHSLAASLNSRPDSPFYQRVKMLGKRASDELNETLSQGTIVRQLAILLAESGKNNVFRDLYEENDDAFMLKILLNYFTAAKEVWPIEWNSNDYILTKTVGFTGLIKAFPSIYKNIDNYDKKFSENKFKYLFSKVSTCLKANNLELKSTYFPSSGAGANKLSAIIIDVLKNNDRFFADFLIK